MKDFPLEILNSGSSENMSILSDEAMSEVFGGKTACNKGYSLGDNGSIKCGCGYSYTKPIPDTPAPPAEPVRPPAPPIIDGPIVVIPQG